MTVSDLFMSTHCHLNKAPGLCRNRAWDCCIVMGERDMLRELGIDGAVLAWKCPDLLQDKREVSKSLEKTRKDHDAKDIKMGRGHVFSVLYLVNTLTTWGAIWFLPIPSADPGSLSPRVCGLVTEVQVAKWSQGRLTVARSLEGGSKSQTWFWDPLSSY